VIFGEKLIPLGVPRLEETVDRILKRGTGVREEKHDWR
jgi:hypothetical protein